MKNMDIGDIRPTQVIDVEDDKDQVLSSPNVQASGSQHIHPSASTSSHHATSSDQLNSSHQAQILQPINVARDHPIDQIVGDINSGV